MSTMKDVAELAGVSLGTVSKVINNIKVGDDYKKRVEEAIVTLDYEVNEQARAIKMNRTNTIAVIVPNLLIPFFSNFVYYTELFLNRNNYKMLLCNSSADKEKEISYIKMASQHKVDGIIGITYNDIQSCLNLETPFVTIDRHLDGKSVCISSDNYLGGVIAAKKLIEMKCEKLAIVMVTSQIHGETNKRKEGFVDTCKNKGADVTVLELIEPVDFKREFEKFIYKNIKQGACDFDGIFFTTDTIALLGMEVINDFGLNIPKDICVIGYDGVAPYGGVRNIVSSIQQPVEIMAEKSVDALIGLINDNVVENEVNLPVKYVYGNTTII